MASKPVKRAREEDDGEEGSMPPPPPRSRPSSGGPLGAGAGGGAGGSALEARRTMWSMIDRIALDAKEEVIIKNFQLDLDAVNRRTVAADCRHVIELALKKLEEDNAAATEAKRLGYGTDAVYECPACNNKDALLFGHSRDRGDVVCLQCGVVVMGRVIDETNQYRAFEDQEDQSHHDTNPDGRFSSAHNARTGIAADIKGESKKLLELHNFVEQNASNMGQNYGRTRQEYKDKRKQQAFALIDRMAHSALVSEVVLERAKDLYAVFRDSTEAEQDYADPKARNKSRWEIACLIAAHRENLADPTKAKVRSGPSVSDFGVGGAGGDGGAGELGSTHEAVVAHKGRFKCEHCGVYFQTFAAREEHIDSLGEALKEELKRKQAERIAAEKKQWSYANPVAGKKPTKRKKKKESNPFFL